MTTHITQLKNAVPKSNASLMDLQLRDFFPYHLYKMDADKCVYIVLLYVVTTCFACNNHLHLEVRCRYFTCNLHVIECLKSANFLASLVFLSCQ